MNDPILTAGIFFAFGFTIAGLLLIPCLAWVLIDFRDLSKKYRALEILITQLAGHNRDLMDQNEGLFHLVSNESDEDSESWKKG